MCKEILRVLRKKPNKDIVIPGNDFLLKEMSKIKSWLPGHGKCTKASYFIIMIQ